MLVFKILNDCVGKSLLAFAFIYSTGAGTFSTIRTLVTFYSIAAIMMVFLENVYYIIVVTWTLFYLFNSFIDFPDLPWSDCSKGGEGIANCKQ